MNGSVCVSAGSPYIYRHSYLNLNYLTIISVVLWHKTFKAVERMSCVGWSELTGHNAKTNYDIAWLRYRSECHFLEEFKVLFHIENIKVFTDILQQ